MIRAILCPDFDPPLKNILFELAWCIVDSVHIKRSLKTKQKRSHKEKCGKNIYIHTYSHLFGATILDLTVKSHQTSVSMCVYIYFSHIFPYVISFALSFWKSWVELYLISKRICCKMKWTKDGVLTDAVWVFIKNKVHPLFPNIEIRRKAMQRLFFHNLALHQILLYSEPSLSFASRHLPTTCLSILNHRVVHSISYRFVRLTLI